MRKHPPFFMKFSSSFFFGLTLVLDCSVLAADRLEVTPTTMDTVVVSSTLLGRTLFDQAQPVSILSGDALRLKLQPTLGDTLASTPGVSSSYFGPAAGRPIIRGLDGDRIRILQNGVNTVDASATSGDHALSFDPVNLEKIEVIRGPATLFYGANAIGGVVNVIDGRIPEERIEQTIRGQVSGRYGSVNTERGGAFTLEGGVGNFAWHLEGYKAATQDLSIPGYARSAQLRAAQPLPNGEQEAYGFLPNSNLRTEGLSGGATSFWDGGFFGASYSGYHANYGTVAEPNVTIDMEQRRLDLRGAFFHPSPVIKTIKYRMGIANYTHTEFEGTTAGTVFKNQGYDGRIEVLHEKLGALEGGLGFQSERSQFSALGEEAFLPPVETRSNAIFVFEEVAVLPLLFQFGLRYDHIQADASEAPGFGPARSRVFNNLSGSIGAIYNPSMRYAIALSGSYSQRAPTYQELYANGPHIATDTFQIGNAGLAVEQAISLDLSLRKKAGRVTGSISVFATRFQNFIGQFATGAVAEGLPVYVYRSSAAEFFGGEMEATIHLLQPIEIDAKVEGKSVVRGAWPLQNLDIELKADYVNATDTVNQTPLPRIPPFRGSMALAYGRGRWGARVESQWVARQGRTAEFEFPTASFYLVNASLSYRLISGPIEWDAFVKATNITNQEARLSTSFLKDIAPLGGRGVVFGLKASF